MEMDGFNRRVVEQGYRVTFVQKNSDIAPIIDVERWYQNDLGQYLVRKDENISFSVIPALGYYDPELYIDGMRLDGYRNEEFTHTGVAALIAAGNADCGLGIYSAAKMYGLDFVELCVEEYDILIDENAFETEKVQKFLEVFHSNELKERLTEMGGYTFG